LANGHVATWNTFLFRPTEIAFGARVVEAATAGSSFLVALEDGTVRAWGTGSAVGGPIPQGATNVVGVALGADHALALRRDGTVVGWGGNSDHQLDIPPSATNVISLSAGFHFSAALRSDGVVVAWGDNSRHQLELPPKPGRVVALSSSSSRFLALWEDGTVAASGLTFDLPPHLINAFSIAAGDHYSLAGVGNGSPRILRDLFLMDDPSGDARLQILAVGTALKYRWFRDNTELFGATNSVLLAKRDGATYKVVIANHLGSAASKDLVAARPVRNLRFDSTSTTFSRIDGFQTLIRGFDAQRPFIVLVSRDLTNWTPLITNVPPFATDTFPIEDTNAIQQKMFYRVIER
jgi:hypothetical protein